MATSSRQLKSLRRSNRHNNKGRSRKGDRFVKLEHWFQDTEAWRSLKPAPRALYIELAKRYNSLNNGEISMSVREAADLIHIAKDTAQKAFKELEAKGFIQRHVCGSFNWKAKQATTWILTNYEFEDQPATKEFARWRAKKKKHGPKEGTRCPGIGTLKRARGQVEKVLVLALGQWTRFTSFLGPKLRHAYSMPCHARILGRFRNLDVVLPAACRPHIPQRGRQHAWHAQNGV